MIGEFRINNRVPGGCGRFFIFRLQGQGSVPRLGHPRELLTTKDF